MDIGRVITEQLESRRKENENKIAASKAFLAAGLTEDEVKQFWALYSSFESLAAVSALAVLLTTHRLHVPSAELGLAVNKYTIDAADWMYRAMKQANVEPDSIGLKNDVTGLADFFAKDNAQFTALVEADKAKQEAAFA